MSFEGLDRDILAKAGAYCSWMRRECGHSEHECPGYTPDLRLPCPDPNCKPRMEWRLPVFNDTPMLYTVRHPPLPSSFIPEQKVEVYRLSPAICGACGSEFWGWRRMP